MSEDTEDWGCAVPGCTRTPKVRGMCRAHYMKRWRDGDLPFKTLEETLVRVRVALPRGYDKALRKLARVSGKKYSVMMREAVRAYLVTVSSLAKG